MPSGVRDALIPSGPYVIVRLLPPVGDAPHYRVKCTADDHPIASHESSDCRQMHEATLWCGATCFAHVLFYMRIAFRKPLNCLGLHLSLPREAA